jgi:hypothetical protein
MRVNHFHELHFQMQSKSMAVCFFSDFRTCGLGENPNANRRAVSPAAYCCGPISTHTPISGKSESVQKLAASDVG